MIFGRINRRDASQETFERRPFADDMSALAQSHQTLHVERGSTGRPSRRWMAADMTVTADGRFMTGVLGFSEQQLHVTFDEESFSWIKAQVEDADAASEQTIAPFAVDLSEHNRWVAFATTNRLQAQGFRKGFELVINEAVSALGLMPTAWEFDLVTSRWRIDEWLSRNPLVHQLTRTLKFTNPGRDLDDDRRQMRALAANRKTEEFKAAYGKTLDTGSEEFRNKLEGTETGDLQVVMRARGSHGVRDVKFSSRDSVDTSSVEEFGTDLQAGIEVVLAALREYVADKAPSAQPALTDDA